MIALPTTGNQDSATPAEKAWLTIADVAAHLQVSERTVQRLIAPTAGRDRLLTARIGGSTRIRRTTLEAYLKARERAT